MQQALLVTTPVDTAVARTHLTQDEISITELFRDNTPSVVFITNLASRCVQAHQTMHVPAAGRGLCTALRSAFSCCFAP